MSARPIEAYADPDNRQSRSIVARGPPLMPPKRATLPNAAAE